MHQNPEAGEDGRCLRPQRSPVVTKERVREPALAETVNLEQDADQVAILGFGDT